MTFSRNPNKVVPVLEEFRRGTYAMEREPHARTRKDTGYDIVPKISSDIITNSRSSMPAKTWRKQWQQFTSGFTMPSPGRKEHHLAQKNGGIQQWQLGLGRAQEVGWSKSTFKGNVPQSTEIPDYKVCDSSQLVRAALILARSWFQIMT